MVGVLAAIADVVGVVAGFAALKVERVSCRAAPPGHSMARCEHGLFLVAALLRPIGHWGGVGIKIATLPQRKWRASPEFVDRKAFSDRHDVPIAAVYAAAQAAWHGRRLGGAEPIEATR